MATAKKEINEVKAEAAQEKPFDINAYLREKVDFYAFKDGGKYKDDLSVSVNGKTFQIKRGVTVRIPRYVRNVIMRSMEQDAKTADLIDAQTSEYAAASKAYGI